jgi:hypothetical protein
MGDYLRNPREFDGWLKANAVLSFDVCDWNAGDGLGGSQLAGTTRWGDRTPNSHCLEMSLRTRRPRLPRKG